MGYHLTLEKTPNPRQKNASGEIFSGSGECTRKTTPQPQTLPRKNDPTPTTTASGVFYYGYRYYNPVTGKWLNRDPIQERGGYNLYGFVGNNGVSRLDFLGLEIELAGPYFSTDLIRVRVNLFLDEVAEGYVSYTFKTYEIKLEDQGNEKVKVKVTGELDIVGYYSFVRQEDAVRDNFGNGVIAHELEHMEITSKFWNEFANIANFYDEIEVCKECGEAIETYLHELNQLYLGYARLYNGEFDAAAYNGGGTESIAEGQGIIKVSEPLVEQYLNSVHEKCSSP